MKPALHVQLTSLVEPADAHEPAVLAPAAHTLHAVHGALPLALLYWPAGHAPHQVPATGRIQT